MASCLPPCFPSLRSTRVKCTFTVQCNTHFGEEVRVVGNCDKLGQWDPAEALEMKWTDGHTWVATTTGIPTDKLVEFKYVLMSGGKVKKWEPLMQNRTVMPHPGMFLVNVFGSIDDPAVPELPDNDEVGGPSPSKVISEPDTQPTVEGPQAGA